MPIKPWTPFRQGQKAVFLPNFTITLLRTPFLPPTFAKFIVPLTLNKLDLKDYLWHAYGIKCTNIRSFVQQQKIRQDDPSRKRAMPRRWFRPKAIKKMTVEMDKPFVWPEPPEDLSPWDKELHDKAAEHNEKYQQKMMPNNVFRGPEDKESLTEQARKLLSGEEKWRPGGQAAENAEQNDRI